MKISFFILASGLLVCFGAGCTSSITTGPENQSKTSQTNPPAVIAQTTDPITQKLVLPIAGYADRRTKKVFGQWVHDRFTGYHLGDDIEYTDTDAEIPVYAIATGTIRYVGAHVSGYGGVLVISFRPDGKNINAIYGHLNLIATNLKVGQTVGAGTFLAYLGKGYSIQTDGERKHLHFGLYEGNELRLAGYTQKKSDLAQWMNPTDFFRAHGLL
ncbi:MAG TPA: M23 family metallopeptidase [Patescibacteria group bacterium]|nr:M23 family metallopeptidase [Patescibacteria group bacterium]